MKYLILLIGLIATFNSYSQTVNSIELKTLDVTYIEVTPMIEAVSSKMKVELDYGQRNKVTSYKDSWLKDINGKYKTFNSIADILNFFHAYNYDLVEVYSSPMMSGTIKVRYILKKGEVQDN